VEALGDDNCHLNVPLGFTYTGFGANTSSVSVSSNGILFFGQNCFTNFTNATLPTALTPNAALFFFWEDLDDFSTSEFLEYATFGTPGGRVFYLFFRARLHDITSCGTNAQTVMVSVHEGSNLVSAAYSGFSSCPFMRGAGATLGMQAAGGAQTATIGVNVPLLDDNSLPQSMSFKP
jgi:hypothetical protein